MFGRSRTARRLEAVIPPLDRAKLLEHLGVDESNPMLLAVLSVIKGNEEIAKLNLAESRQNDVKPGFWDGSLAACMQIQEDLLELAEEGRRSEGRGQRSEVRGRRSA